MNALDAFGPRSWARTDVISSGRLSMSTYLSRRNEVSLDGAWRFTLVPKPESVSTNHLDGDAAQWSLIDVPGCWTMQGFDRPIYTNVQMPFPGPPPAVPRHNPTGIYRRTVDIPADWDGQRIVLHIGAAETVLYAFIDGAPVGMGKDSRLPHEFDITPFVTAGDAVELALVVVRWSDATYLEDQDHWHHAGLHRSVFLYATPPVHIADVHAVADYDADAGDGELTARVAIGGTPPSRRGWRVRVAFAGQEGDGVARFEHESWIVNSFAFEGRGGTVSFGVPSVAPWTAETPTLYPMRVELVDDAGAVVDATQLDIGFRRVEVVGAELLVNGQPVLIKGVNRHDSDARRGKAVTRENIERDIVLMKRHNFNAVRTAHYPNDPYLLDVCDRLGMYVVDEANIESHAYLRSLTKQPEWTAPILERVSRMAQRDKNHPSVIMWSLGNESGVSAAHHAAAAWLRAWDATRPIHYESGISEDQMREGGQRYGTDILGRDRPETDVIAPMYPPVEALVAWATETTPAKPLIMCEYIHAMGNSCGGVEEYWNAIRTHHGLQGGFMWDWADQALVQTMKDGSERLAYGGDFGDEPNDGAFCMNGLVDTHRVPHPSLLELAHAMQPVQFEWADANSFRVANEFAFTNLSSLLPVWQDEVATGSLDPIDVGPGESAVVTVPASGDLITLRFVTTSDTPWAPAGHVIAWAQVARNLPSDAPGEVAARHLAAYEPTLALWAAPIDNETFGGGHAARWDHLGLRDGAGVALLTAVTDGVGIAHTVDLPEVLADPPRVGVRLHVGPGVATVEWFGRGPHETYSDRCASARLGVWRVPVDAWSVPYVHPQHSGNRTGVRWLRLLGANDNVVLTVDHMDDLNVNVARVTEEELDAAQHLEDLPVRDDCYLWIDAGRRGVGSGACGPDTAEAHRIKPGTYTWSYRLR
ncbi:MAG: DUF4981 domain-containing protein [Actinobacteria bacterium]|nr:DUF4981 domain-containing protein [Actinomycetota bacterium]